MSVIIKTRILAKCRHKLKITFCLAIWNILNSKGEDVPTAVAVGANGTKCIPLGTYIALRKKASVIESVMTRIDGGGACGFKNKQLDAQTVRHQSPRWENHLPPSVTRQRMKWENVGLFRSTFT